MKHRNGIFCKESAGTVNVIMSIIRGTIVGQKRDDNWVANWFPREKFDPGNILILWNMHFHCWNFEKQRRREEGGAEKEVEGKKVFLAHLFCSLRGSDKENQAILWALFGLTWQMVELADAALLFPCAMLVGPRVHAAVLARKSFTTFTARKLAANDPIEPPFSSTHRGYLKLASQMWVLSFWGGYIFVTFLRFFVK